MTIDALKFNIFSTNAGRIKQTKPAGTSSEGTSGGGAAFKGTNFFAGKTVGINEATLNTPVFASAQVGKNPGLLGANFQGIG